MSVQSEIDRISQNVTNTYAVLEALGADMPEEQTSDNLSTTAGSAKAVLYAEQTLTDEQKAQARSNIGAAAEGGGGVQPDYNQWDSNQADYIRNRPFYDGYSPVAFDGSVELSENGDGVLEPYFEMIPGTVYSVNYNGTVYTLAANSITIEGMDHIVWGNETMVGGGANSEVPITIVLIPSYQIAMMQDVAGTVSTTVRLIVVEGENIGDTVTLDNRIDGMYQTVDRVSKNIITKDDLSEGYRITLMADGVEHTIDETECTFRDLPGMTQIEHPTYGYVVWLSTGEVYPAGVGLLNKSDVSVKSFTINNSGAFSTIIELKRMDEKFLPESVESVVIRSSTNDSTKLFRITVDDSGTLAATEITT